MTTENIITICAIFLGPIFAVLATEWIRKSREDKERKVLIFKTLMSTRASAVSPNHVEALNLIEVEFGTRNGKDRQVSEAWKLYHSHLSDLNFDSEVWRVKTEDLLIELLHAMAKNLGFAFDKARIKQSAYHPQGLGDIQRLHHDLLANMNLVMRGDSKLKIESSMSDEQVGKIFRGADSTPVPQRISSKKTD